MQKNQAHVRYSAGQYDNFTATFVKAFDDSLAENLVREVRKRPGATLLDIGTGTARFLIHLARDSRFSGVRLVGSDLFPDMITQARDAVEAEGLDGIELFEDDVHNMRLSDNYADIIVSRSTIHHWQNPPQAFREIYRVLKANGIAIICDVRRDAAPHAIESFNRIRAEAGLPPSYLEEKFTAAEVEEFSRQAGIGEVSHVFAPSEGMDALGLALVIEKPAAAATSGE